MADVNSRVMTADLGVVNDLASGCSNMGFQLCRLASDRLNIASMDTIDGVIFYIPDVTNGPERALPCKLDLCSRFSDITPCCCAFRVARRFQSCAHAS